MSYVYFIREDRDGLIKIGTAKDPDARLKELQCGCPSTLEILRTVPGDRDLERAYHMVFADFRVRGEWFAPNPAVMLAACHMQFGRWGNDNTLGPWAWLKSLLSNLVKEPDEHGMREFIIAQNRHLS